MASSSESEFELYSKKSRQSKKKSTGDKRKHSSSKKKKNYENEDDELIANTRCDEHSYSSPDPLSIDGTDRNSLEPSSARKSTATMGIGSSSVEETSVIQSSHSQLSLKDSQKKEQEQDLMSDVFNKKEKHLHSFKNTVSNHDAADTQLSSSYSLNLVSSSHSLNVSNTIHSQSSSQNNSSQKLTIQSNAVGRNNEAGCNNDDDDFVNVPLVKKSLNKVNMVAKKNGKTKSLSTSAMNHNKTAVASNKKLSSKKQREFTSDFNPTSLANDNDSINMVIEDGPSQPNEKQPKSTKVSLQAFLASSSSLSSCSSSPMKMLPVGSSFSIHILTPKYIQGMVEKDGIEDCVDTGKSNLNDKTVQKRKEQVCALSQDLVNDLIAGDDEASIGISPLQKRSKTVTKANIRKLLSPDLMSADEVLNYNKPQIPEVSDAETRYSTEEEGDPYFYQQKEFKPLKKSKPRISPQINTKVSKTIESTTSENFEEQTQSVSDTHFPEEQKYEENNSTSSHLVASNQAIEGSLSTSLVSTTLNNTKLKSSSIPNLHKTLVNPSANKVGSIKKLPSPPSSSILRPITSNQDVDSNTPKSKVISNSNSFKQSPLLSANNTNSTSSPIPPTKQQSSSHLSTKPYSNLPAKNATVPRVGLSKRNKIPSLLKPT